MNIDCFGVKVVDKLYDNQLIENVADIYKLQKTTITVLTVVETERYELINSIEKYKPDILRRLIVMGLIPCLFVCYVFYIILYIISDLFLFLNRLMLYQAT